MALFNVFQHHPTKYFHFVLSWLHKILSLTVIYKDSSFCNSFLNNLLCYVHVHTNLGKFITAYRELYHQSHWASESQRIAVQQIQEINQRILLIWQEKVCTKSLSIIIVAYSAFISGLSGKLPVLSFLIHSRNFSQLWFSLIFYVGGLPNERRLIL